MNNSTVLFEGIVMDVWKSNTTDPPSEIVDISYPLPPIPVYECYYDEDSLSLKNKMVDINNHGWIQITLPTFNRLKPGDKIQIIKI